MQPLELTLVVAASRNMGIGINGTMPWKGLRKEMQYFARVTSRLPPQAPPGAVNAVIMGRKTWDSIPEKFRPLQDRLNIIITSSAPPPSATSPPSPLNTAEPVRVPSLESAIKYASAAQKAQALGRVFVMGGAQIYGAALGLPQARRVLLTKIEKAFECDTFFPVNFEGGAEGWTRRSAGELAEWTGEDVEAVGALQEEKATKYEFQMWEKET